MASFKGSRAEQLLMVFCKQTKLRYNKLTEEEKQWLNRIVQKSELEKMYGYLKQPCKINDNDTDCIYKVMIHEDKDGVYVYLYTSIG